MRSLTKNKGMNKRGQLNMLLEFMLFIAVAVIICVLTGHGLKDPDTAIREAKKPVKMPNNIEALEAYV